jgi:type IV secretory pathway VirJ component
MKNLFLIISLVLLIPTVSKAGNTDSLKYGSFGKLYIYKPAATPDALVLFVSGDGGWNQLPIKIGNQLVARGAMVVGINIHNFMINKMAQHEKCYYPAGDFEELSLYLQKKYKFKNYLKPILLGYSSGATLVYGILAQAPANTFKGALAMGFCPDIASIEPLCTTNALKQHPTKPGGPIWLLEPSEYLTAPFIAINGLDDKICDYKNTEAFMKKVNTGELIGVPKAGHGMSVQKNYLPHLIDSYNKIKKSASYPELVSAKHQATAAQQAEKLTTDLPLILLPVARNDTLPLLVFISGDGGWTSFDQGVSEKLAEKGIPVIGLDAQKYFWEARTPESTAAELTKVIHYYMAAWNKKSFVLCGYSFGADVIPFMVTRLPGDLKYMLKSAVMMSPDPKADFEIHVADMLSFGSKSDKYNVLAEVKKSSSLGHVTCIFGKDEESETPTLFKNAGATIKLLPGSHHYNNDFNGISNEIINSMHKK